MMKASAQDLFRGDDPTTTTTTAGRCVTVASYLEAVGLLAAHKAGVNPACLTANIPPIRKLPPAADAPLVEKALGVVDGVEAGVDNDQMDASNSDASSEVVAADARSERVQTLQHAFAD